MRQLRHLGVQIRSERGQVVRAWRSQRRPTESVPVRTSVVEILVFSPIPATAPATNFRVWCFMISWMNSSTNKRVRGTTGAFAALTLILFFWLAFAITKFSTIFQGLRVPLPIDTRIVVTYLPIGLPLLGILAAALILLLDFFRPRRWLPLQLTSACLVLWLLLAMFAFQSLFFSVPFSTLSSSHEPPSTNNK